MRCLEVFYFPAARLPRSLYPDSLIPIAQTRSRTKQLSSRLHGLIGDQIIETTSSFTPPSKFILQPFAARFGYFLRHISASERKAGLTAELPRQCWGQSDFLVVIHYNLKQKMQRKFKKKFPQLKQNREFHTSRVGRTIFQLFSR